MDNLYNREGNNHSVKKDILNTIFTHFRVDFSYYNFDLSNLELRNVIMEVINEAFKDCRSKEILMECLINKLERKFPGLFVSEESKNALRNWIGVYLPDFKQDKTLEG